MGAIRLLLVVLLGMSLSSSEAQWGVFQASSTINAWQTLKVGGGGWVRGIDIKCDQGVGMCNNSGTTSKIARGDGYGLYKWISGGKCTINVAAPCWQQLVSSISLPSGDPTNAPGVCLNNGCNTWDARLAPSNTQIIYMMLDGYVYVSANQGVTWSATTFTHDTTSSPNTNGQFDPKIAIDPANANIAVVCTAANGCFSTSNGGSSWIAVTGLTNSSTVMLVAFDPTSTVTGGATQGIYIASYGHGIYHTTGGVSGSWTSVASAPSTQVHILVDTNGTLWAVDDASGGNGGNVWKYASSAWTEVLGSECCASVAVNPNNANDVIAVQQSGQTYYSTNAGSTFTAAQTITLAASDVPWLTTTGTFMTAGDIVYDPAQSNTLFFSAGVGVWYSTPSTGASVTWNSQTAGIENLTGIQITSAQGGNPFLSAWDFQVFDIVNPNVYATSSTRGTVSGGFTEIAGAWGVDYASQNTSTIVCICNSNIGDGDFSGYSSNGGGSWSQFGAVPSGVPATNYGGAIAAASSNVMVWITSNNGKLYETSNGGATWTAPSITGIATSGTIGWHDNYFLNRSNVCADRAAVNTTFYAYNEGSAGSTAGIYKGTYNGSTWTWTAALSGAVGSNTSFNAELKCVPGNAGDMYFTAGNQTPGPYPHSQSFYECTDTAGTVACSAIANVQEVWAFGFGSAKPGGSGYPAVYIVGWVSGLFGVWRSTDHALTWTNLGIPLNNLDQIVAVSGDSNVYGKVYVQFHTSGAAWGQFNYLLSRDLDPTSNDNSPAWLNEAA